MKNIEINNSLVLQHCNDIDEPVYIHRYIHEPYRNEPFDVKRVQVIVQIFHTELKHFDLRKAKLIDSDERRPIFAFVFDSKEKHMTWWLKRHPYMMAFQQVEFIDVDGEIVPGCGRICASDLYRFRSFTAWLEHITTGGIQSMFVTDCCVTEADGGSLLSVPDCTIDDLVACLKEDKPLIRKEVDVVGKEGLTVDGVTLRPDQFFEHMTQKAMLERMEEGVVN